MPALAMPRTRPRLTPGRARCFLALVNREADPAPGADAAELALVARLQAGDAEAFETLVRDNAGRMLAVARRLLRNEADAADAVQEAFVAAFRSIGDFAGHARLSTWLHRVTVNAALMRLRSKSRKPETSIDDMLPSFLEDGHQAHPAAAWPEGADVVLERDQERSAVRACIDRLPESYRTVLVLRDIEELDPDETARILGVNTNVVKVRLHRARQALRGLLDETLHGGRR